MSKDKIRCNWVNLNYKNYIKYHDEEWGTPVYDDYKLFELLILESAQAGLSWITILNKREFYRKAYDNFDFNKIAKYNSKKVKSLITNKNIIRNKLKINSSINNAKVFLKIRSEYNSFSNYIWSYVNYKPINNKVSKNDFLPVESKLSKRISSDLKAKGMTFIGPIIIYSYMQAIGLVNDHSTNCFRYKELIKNKYKND